MTSECLKIAILASGQGTNAQLICELAKRHPQRLQVVAIISDRSDCPLLSAEIFSEIKKIHIAFPHGKIPLEQKRAHFDMQLAQVAIDLQAQWLVLAGFMRMVGPELLSKFWSPELSRFKVINLHPSQLPFFPGLQAMEKSFEAAKAMGPTIHYVDEKLDHGPIIMRLPVPKFKKEKFDFFKKRVKRAEYFGISKVMLELAYLGRPQGENREVAAF